MTSIHRMAVLALAVLAASLASAAPVHYAESVSGDLPALPSSAFALDVGDNTFSGTTQFLLFHNGIHYDADPDSFAFTVPNDVLLASVFLSFRLAADNVSLAYSELELCSGIGDCAPGAATYLGAQTVSYLDVSPLGVDFGAPTPLGGGTYTLFDHGIGIAPVDPHLPEGWIADYTWTLQVVPVATPVPEPQTFGMWALGMIGVLCAARRRGRATRASATKAASLPAGA